MNPSIARRAVLFVFCSLALIVKVYVVVTSGDLD
jgi:hypothetical protein